MVLPFHPALCRVQTVLHSFHQEFIDEGFDKYLPVLVFALGGRSIARLVHGHGRRKLSEHREGTRVANAR